MRTSLSYSTYRLQKSLLTSRRKLSVNYRLKGERDIFSHLRIDAVDARPLTR